MCCTFIWFQRLGISSVLLIAAAGVAGAAQPEGGAAAVQPAQPVLARDCYAEFCALMPQAPAGERAFEVYLEAMERLGEPIEGPVYQAAADGLIAPGSDIWEEARKLLGGRREALDLVRRGAAMPVMGAPFVPDFKKSPQQVRAEAVRNAAPHRLRRLPEPEPLREGAPLWFHHQPMVLPLREFGSVLRLDTIVAAGEGDAERAVANVAALCGLARHTRETPTFMAGATAAGLLVWAAGDVMMLLRRYPGLLSDEQLLEVERILAGAEAPFRTDGERIIVADVVQRLYSDDGEGGGVLNAQGVREFHAGDPESDPLGLASATRTGSRTAGFLHLAARGPDRRRFGEIMTRHFDAADAEAGKPSWEASPTAALVEIDRLDNWLVNRFAQGVGASMRIHFLAAHARDGALAAVAIHRFRRARDEWPESLDVLVPAYLAAVPRDMYTGEPLRYRPPAVGEPAGRGPWLYSVGGDRDDDGGRPATSGRAWTNEDGDWVFLGG